MSRPVTRRIPAFQRASAHSPNTAAGRKSSDTIDGSPLPITTRSPFRTPDRESIDPAASRRVSYLKSQPSRSAATASVCSFMFDAGITSFAESRW
jgi:hypothetical protein